MLDDDAYLHWLDQCGFSDPARTLLTEIRRSPPVRRVAGGRGNIHGRYPSRKMRITIQFESHTELGAIYVMEHDPSVLEYYDQPTKLKLHYLGPSGRRVTNWHPPDFLVLRQEGASFEEWKREEERGSKPPVAGSLLLSASTRTSCGEEPKIAQECGRDSRSTPEQAHFSASSRDGERPPL